MKNEEVTVNSPSSESAAGIGVDSETTQNDCVHCQQ